MSKGLLFASILALICSGCDCGSSTADAGFDSGTPDSGHDAGIDGGPGDSGTPDSGTPDSGTPDAGNTDAGNDGGAHACVSGQNTSCALPGAQGICCNGTCVDSLTDPDNCGFCSTYCANGDRCSNGNCAEADGGFPTGCDGGCPAGTACFAPPGIGFAACFVTDCTGLGDGTQCSVGNGSGECCGGSCVMPLFDDHNCSVCGATCPTGESCYNGSCSINHNPIFTCDGGCAAGSDCKAGACVPETCAPQAQGQRECSLSASTFGLGTCCESACVDTSRDPTNCGACGNACPAGSFCNIGFCVFPSCGGVASDQECARDAGVLGFCCDQACSNTQSDPLNCGQCGLACPNTSACVNGQCTTGCQLQTCPADTACDTASGYCRVIDCAGAADGEQCMFDPAHHGGQCCGGRCINPYSDPDNCGGCGHSEDGGVCIAGDLFPPPAGISCTHELCPVDEPCSGNYCTAQSCQGHPFSLCAKPDAGAGFGQCCPPTLGSLQAICVDTQTDPDHCGFCDEVCPAGQTCRAGHCEEGTCGPGEVGGFCDADAGTSFLCCPGGGCTDTRGDPNNCGACGTVCGSGMACDAGACQ